MTALFRATGASLLSVVVAGTVAAAPAGAVPGNGPEIEMTAMYFMGEQAEPTFRAVQFDAATFTYRLDDGPTRTVPVGPDGSTTVRIDVPVTEPTEHTLSVYSSTAEGGRSHTSTAWLLVNRAAPMISLPPEFPVLGDTTEFLFTSDQPRIVSYTFWVGSGPRTTIPAEPDGRGRAQWVATVGGIPRYGSSARRSRATRPLSVGRSSW